MVPNHAFTKVASGVPKSVRFTRLNNSARNSRAIPSRAGILKPRSHRQKLEPLSARRSRRPDGAFGALRKPLCFPKRRCSPRRSGDVEIDRVKAGPAVKVGQKSIGRGKKVSNSTLNWLRVHGSRATLVADHQSRHLKWVSRELSCPAITTGSLRWPRFAGGWQCRAAVLR